MNIEQRTRVKKVHDRWQQWEEDFALSVWRNQKLSASQLGFELIEHMACMQSSRINLLAVTTVTEAARIAHAHYCYARTLRAGALRYGAE